MAHVLIVPRCRTPSAFRCAGAKGYTRIALVADGPNDDPAFVRAPPMMRHGEDPRPTAWLEACLARIDATNAALNAVVALDRAGCRRASLDSARRWQAGAPLSPIDGMPVLVKANIAVAGLPWHAGIAAYRHRIAPHDAPAVARLRSAGAVILGLTNMDEGALGATGDNPWLGRIGNPRDATLSAGGSSGGSAAAVAAGYCAAALGSDTIGSIAIPAAYCGVVGHRAGRGVLPLAGIVPLSPTFDHAGWHARSAADAQSVGRALGLAAPAPGQIRIASLAPDTLDIPPAFTAALEIGSARVRQAGWSVDRTTLPAGSGDIARRMFEVAEAEAAIVHRDMLADRPEGFSPAFRRYLHWGAGHGASRREANLAVLRDIAAKMRQSLTGTDALLMPAVPHTGFACGSPPPADQALFAAWPACLGWPATTVPVGGDGAALLVIAASDATCLEIADRISAHPDEQG